MSPLIFVGEGSSGVMGAGLRPLGHAIAGWQAKAHPLSLRSEFVSPGYVKMNEFLITRDDCKKNSTCLSAAVCAALTTSADCCKNAVLPLGNLGSIR